MTPRDENAEWTDSVTRGIEFAPPPARVGRRIAIVGSAPSTRNMVPWDDPDLEIWGLAWRCNPVDMKRFDAGFEIHRREHFINTMTAGVPEDKREQVLSGYMKLLGTLTCPVYMQEVHEDIPGSIKYPLDEVVEACGADYFMSSVGYMLGLAIYQHKQGQQIAEIGIWGVDMMLEDEWGHQNSAATYLMGICHGLGIKITIPEQCPLLKSNHRYGWDLPKLGWATPEFFEQDLKIYREKLQENREARTAIGAICKAVRTMIRNAEEAGLDGIPLESLMTELPKYEQDLARVTRTADVCDGWIQAGEHFILMAKHIQRGRTLPTMPDKLT